MCCIYENLNFKFSPISAHLPHAFFGVKWGRCPKGKGQRGSKLTITIKPVGRVARRLSSHEVAYRNRGRIETKNSK